MEDRIYLHEYKALLALFMCSDPWPASNEEQSHVETLLNREAKLRGFDNWVDAYHGM